MEIKRLEYDASIDYFPLLLDFATKNPYYEGNTNYLALIKDTSKNETIVKYATNIFWFNWVATCHYFKNKVSIDANKIARSMDKVPDLNQWIFLTVGFDDTTNINGHTMLAFAHKIFNINIKRDHPLCKDALFSLEKHRTDKSGKQYIHHHIHFLINLVEHCRPGKIVELVFAVAGIKKFCREKNFIDVKTPNSKEYSKRAQPYAVCDNYCRGIKTVDKSVCVADDILWRQSLGLETYYEISRSSPL